MRTFRLIAITLCSSVLISCSPSEQKAGQGMDLTSLKGSTNMNVRENSTLTYKKDPDVPVFYEINGKKYTLETRDNHLKLNGVSYGTFQSHDKIEVITKEDGIGLSVNGIERKPRETSSTAPVNGPGEHH